MGKIIARGPQDRVSKAMRALSARHAIEPQRIQRFEARMSRLTDVRKRGANAERWCILRTSARNTVQLVDELESDGFDVWTPIEIEEKRVGKSRDRLERCQALMPSFVFGAERDVSNLLRLSANPLKRCSEFSVYHARDRVPLIADRNLGPLRDREASGMLQRDRVKREVLRRKAQSLPIGHMVNMPDGAFGGLSGVVMRSRGPKTTVSLNGQMEIEVDTFLLLSDAI